MHVEVLSLGFILKHAVIAGLSFREHPGQPFNFRHVLGSLSHVTSEVLLSFSITHLLQVLLLQLLIPLSLRSTILVIVVATCVGALSSRVD